MHILPQATLEQLVEYYTAQLESCTVTQGQKVLRFKIHQLRQLSQQRAAGDVPALLSTARRQRVNALHFSQLWNPSSYT